jgi:hypothetical protein
MVSVEVGEFAVEALAGEAGNGAGHVPARVSRAIRIYLGDRGAERPGWRYPGFLRHPDTTVREKLELDVDEELWAEFVAEAGRQGITVEQLTEHAALYLAAEVNAGRITERILDDFEDEGEEERG